jgi:hypothetical protein
MLSSCAAYSRLSFLTCSPSPFFSGLPPLPSSLPDHSLSHRQASCIRRGMCTHPSHPEQPLTLPDSIARGHRGRIFERYDFPWSKRVFMIEFTQEERPPIQILQESAQVSAQHSHDCSPRARTCHHRRVCGTPNEILHIVSILCIALLVLATNPRQRHAGDGPEHLQHPGSARVRPYNGRRCVLIGVPERGSDIFLPGDRTHTECPC